MLDNKTLNLMRELFDNQKCVRCGKIATRLVRHKFYCQEHLPGCSILKCETPKIYKNHLDRK